MPINNSGCEQYPGNRATAHRRVQLHPVATHSCRSFPSRLYSTTDGAEISEYRAPRFVVYTWVAIRATDNENVSLDDGRPARMFNLYMKPN